MLRQTCPEISAQSFMNLPLTSSLRTWVIAAMFLPQNLPSLIHYTGLKRDNWPKLNQLWSLVLCLLSICLNWYDINLETLVTIVRLPLYLTILMPNKVNLLRKKRRCSGKQRYKRQKGNDYLCSCQLSSFWFQILMLTEYN